VHKRLTLGSTNDSMVTMQWDVVKPLQKQGGIMPPGGQAPAETACTLGA
jgi:hypothetical protein